MIGAVPPLLLYAFMDLIRTILCLFYFFLVIPRRLNFMCRLFGSPCSVILRCVTLVVCRKANGKVNIGHEDTTVVVWIYGGV